MDRGPEGGGRRSRDRSTDGCGDRNVGRRADDKGAQRAVEEGAQSLNLLILNGDLPVFPGWGGVEYLHTVRLARLARRVALVSLAHTREQQDKAQSLSDAGVSL